MKTNWYTLGAFVAVVGAIVAAHLAHIDELYKVLASVGFPLILALTPALLQKGGAQ